MITGNRNSTRSNNVNNSSTNITFQYVENEVRDDSSLSESDKKELLNLLNNLSDEDTVPVGYFGRFSDWIEKHPTSLQFVGNILTRMILGGI